MHCLGSNDAPILVSCPFRGIARMGELERVRNKDPAALEDQKG